MKRLNIRLEISALLIGVTVAFILYGCGIFRMARTGSFSHAAHAAQEIECDACHYDQDAGGMGMPAYRTCLPCHGPSDIRDSYPYEKRIQEQDPDLAFRSGRLAPDLKFSHETHAREGIDCFRCHGEPDSPPAPFEPRMPEPGTCQDCHRERGLNSECSHCHGDIRRDAPPPSHRPGTWIRTHGRTVAFGLNTGHQEGCILCHSRNDCDECHQVEKPADHTEFFRLRGHGLQVSISRERCSACHQQSFCIRCHENTRPRSHMGLWGGSRSNHCLYCHESLGGTGCSVCHEAAPGHDQATAVPPPPHPGPTSDCRHCHLRPPHADNGGSCILCHR